MEHARSVWFAVKLCFLEISSSRFVAPTIGGCLGSIILHASRDQARASTNRKSSENWPFDQWPGLSGDHTI